MSFPQTANNKSDKLVYKCLDVDIYLINISESIFFSELIREFGSQYRGLRGYRKFNPITERYRIEVYIDNLRLIAESNYSNPFLQRVYLFYHILHTLLHEILHILDETDAEQIHLHFKKVNPI